MADMRTLHVFFIAGHLYLELHHICGCESKVHRFHFFLSVVCFIKIAKMFVFAKFVTLYNGMLQCDMPFRSK